MLGYVYKAGSIAFLAKLAISQKYVSLVVHRPSFSACGASPVTVQ